MNSVTKLRGALAGAGILLALLAGCAEVPLPPRSVQPAAPAPVAAPVAPVVEATPAQPQSSAVVIPLNPSH